MKTAKEYFERLQNDEEFKNAVDESLTAKLQSGETDHACRPFING